LYAATPYCALTGKPFDLTQKRTTVSIDRIDPGDGYVLGNVRLVRWHANNARNEFGDEALYELAEDLLAYRKKLRSSNAERTTGTD
jgi:repressor of nif and glnA expression